MVLLITLSVTIGQVESFMNICWLSSTLEPFAQNFSSQMWFLRASKETNPQITELIKNNLERSIVELSAVLGKSTLKLKELLNLEIGDVIILDKRVDEEIDMLVQGMPKFQGIPGKHRGKVAVKITKVSDEIQDILQNSLQGLLSGKSGGESSGRSESGEK